MPALVGKVFFYLTRLSQTATFWYQSAFITLFLQLSTSETSSYFTLSPQTLFS